MCQYKKIALLETDGYFPNRRGENEGLGGRGNGPPFGRGTVMGSKTTTFTSFKWEDPDGEHNPMRPCSPDALCQIWSVSLRQLWRGRVFCENKGFGEGACGPISRGAQLKVKAWSRCLMESLVGICLVVSDKI